jgi:LCP family protein required for cell wall assembly
LLLAVAMGLGVGLVLAKPLADLLTSQRPGEGTSAFSNPFSAWSVGISNQNLLLLGTDVGGGNTDVIAVLNVEDGVTHIIQIPRDTYVEAERYGPLKINALYSLGGIDAIKQEISYHLNRPIQHHLVVNLSAIRRMADQLGGIEVDVPKRMVYSDRSQGLVIDLQPGPHTLQGRELEGFLRFRHDQTGDLGRMERQQLALKALFRKLTQPQNILRLPALLLAGGKDLRTDLGPMELGGLITGMANTNLETQRLDGRPFNLNGISYWDADWASTDGSRGHESTSHSATGNNEGKPRPSYRFGF